MNPDTITAIVEEIRRANLKHGSGRLATGPELVSILVEEVGELAQAINKQDWLAAQFEMVQVAAVAVNWLEGTGPHCSKL